MLISMCLELPCLGQVMSPKQADYVPSNIENNCCALRRDNKQFLLFSEKK